ncbi:MAG: RiPP maturation radical SAM C-methyltransferase [Vulcanimicrobiota bacterium]
MKKGTFALINMPFAPADAPSIQLGLLKSLLINEGLPAEDFYFNVDFYNNLQEYGYSKIYKSTLPSLLSEWFFSPVPFNEKEIIAGMEYGKLQGFASDSNLTVPDLVKIKEELAPTFVNDIAAKYNWESYSFALFTLSYAQINSSFALAKKIKEINPNIKTIFGGAFSQIHEHSIKEFMNYYSFIDYFVLGEAEPVLTRLIKAPNTTEFEKLPGIFFRNNNTIIHIGGISSLKNMDAAVIPNYDTYFQKLKDLSPAERFHLKKTIPVEFARGCIWGQKNPCTFCAFYPCGGYRRKSPDKILKEMNLQMRNYRSGSFYVMDAAVPSEMIADTFSRFQGLYRKPLISFVETRTDLDEEEIALLKQGGVKMVQPGIECLEPGLLKKINKGVSLYDNLNYLKNCRKYEIGVSYNIILGLPDASTAELENQLRILKAVTHLAPPFPMPLSLVRFSEYYRNPEKFGLSNFKPEPFYKYIHPQEIDLQQVAFEFTANLPDSPYRDSIYRKTIGHIKQWQYVWASPQTRPYLEMKVSPLSLTVTDGRNNPGKPAEFKLKGIKREIYLESSSRPRNIDYYLKTIDSATEEELTEVLNWFTENNLMLENHGLYYALAVKKRVVF